MFTSVRAMRSGLWLGLIWAVLLGTNGCVVKFVADYDAVTFEEILRVGKKVDRFYGDLLETAEAERKYTKYSDKYVEIETDIRSLITRNKARAINRESTEIAEIILKLWSKYKESHQRKDAYMNGAAKLDRGRFVRLFNSAAAAEEAKKLDPDDRDSEMDSKDRK